MGLNEDERDLRIEVQRKVWEVATCRESFLRQKERIKWTKEGDLNSKFFHSMINWKRKRNMIRGLHVREVWEDDLKKVKEEVAKLFLNRFLEGEDGGISLDGVYFNLICHENNLLLSSKFEELELKEAIWDCRVSKSLGSDGFNFNFIKKFWSVLKVDTMRLIC